MFKKTLKKLFTAYVITEVLSITLALILYFRKIFIFNPSSTGSQPSWGGLLFLIFIIFIFITVIFAVIGLATFVYKDAKRRGMHPLLWTIISILLPYFTGFIIYLLVRKPLPVTCPECGATIQGEEIIFCPNCGKRINTVCEKCKRVIKENVNFCPYCGNKIK